MDYWTNGRFSELEKRVAEELKKLENPDDLNIDEVKAIREQVDALKEEEQKLIVNAEEKVIASQIRAELGDIAVEALEQEGFDMVRSGYERTDQRRAYIVNLQNIGGADVVVSFLPQEESNENILDVQIKNEVNYSEEETRNIINSIIAILQEEGIHVGNVKCEENHLEEFYDFDKIFDKDGGLPQKAVQEKGGILIKDHQNTQ
ncbi:MAG: hypothetical protein R2788_19190 [Saprospiraceae bacterium]